MSENVRSNYDRSKGGILVTLYVEHQSLHLSMTVNMFIIVAMMMEAQYNSH